MGERHNPFTLRAARIGGYIDCLMALVERTTEPDPAILDRIERALGEYERAIGTAEAWHKLYGEREAEESAKEPADG